MQLPTRSAVAPIAQWYPGPHGPAPHGPHWGGGTGMGTAGSGGFVAGGGWWLLLVVVLLLGLIAVALILAARRSDSAADPALATLRERYAAGDLDDEAFDRRRERLRERTG